MRRKDREITDFGKMLDIVASCDVCRIAMHSDEDVPYLVPLNFGHEISDGVLYLYFHSASAGTKFELLQKYPRVRFEMDCGHQLVLQDRTMNCTMEF